MNLVLLKRIANKLSSYCMKPFNLVNAIWFVKKYKRNDDIYTIVLDKGIGDTVFVLRVLDEIKKNYPDLRVKIVANISHKNLFTQFFKDCEYEFYYKNDKKVNAFIHSKIAAIIGKRYNIINTNPYLYYDKKLHDCTEIYILRRYVFGIFYNNHRIIYENTKLPNIGRKNSNILILNPYTYSISQSSMDIYVDIAESASELGYDVYTNCIGSQIAIPKTKRLNCTIEELYTFSEKAAGIISIRSGILDYLVTTNIPMLVFYENCSKKFKKIYTMKQWRNDNSIIEIDLKYAEKNEILHRIKGWLIEIYNQEIPKG